MWFTFDGSSWLNLYVLPEVRCKWGVLLPSIRNFSVDPTPRCTSPVVLTPTVTFKDTILSVLIPTVSMTLSAANEPDTAIELLDSECIPILLPREKWSFSAPFTLASRVIEVSPILRRSPLIYALPSTYNVGKIESLSSEDTTWSGYSGLSVPIPTKLNSPSILISDASANTKLNSYSFVKALASLINAGDSKVSVLLPESNESILLGFPKSCVAPASTGTKKYLPELIGGPV